MTKSSQEGTQNFQVLWWTTVTHSSRYPANFPDKSFLLDFFASQKALRANEIIMAGKLKIFSLLMRKNFLVRRRSWIASLIGEFLVPFGLVLSIWAVRNFSSNAPRVISNNTIYELNDQQSIIGQGTFENYVNVYFAPANDFTQLLISDAVACTQINNSCKYKAEFSHPTKEINK